MKRIKQFLINLRLRIFGTDYRTTKKLNSQIANLNYKVDLIMDYFMDAASAKPATGQLAVFQNEILDILLVFKKIADKHDFPYWLDYGTLLGAVRHGGFVPWDSDADVSFLEENLDRLTDILNGELPEEYEFGPAYLDRVYRITKKDENSHAFLDLYPYFKNGKDDDGNDKIRMKKGGDKPNTIKRKAFRTFPSNILFPFSEVTFCGHIFKAPHDTDTYLRLKYGNYHLMPKSVHTVPGHYIPKEDIVFYDSDFPNYYK